MRTGARDQVLLGVTGSGKTFTMAHVIAQVQKPTLILAPNKILAAQLYGEMKSFFPNNAVEYFVLTTTTISPRRTCRARIPTSRKPRRSTSRSTACAIPVSRALLERDDVIIVASVSCIYGIGSPEVYAKMVLNLRKGQRVERARCCEPWSSCSTSGPTSTSPRTFRARGDTIEIFPAHLEDRAWRLSLFGDEVDGDRRVRPADRRAAPRRATHDAASTRTAHYVMPEARARRGGATSIQAWS